MDIPRRFFLILFAIVFTHATCRAEPESRYHEAREAVVRRLFADSKDAEVLLVAFGTTSSGAYIDPPADFLKRLADLPKPVRPASAGEFQETVKSNRFSGYRETASKKRAWLYSITVRPLSATQAELVVTSSGGALSGGELTFDATLTPQGRWQVKGPRVSAIF